MLVKKDGSLWWADDKDKKAIKRLEKYEYRLRNVKPRIFLNSLAGVLASVLATQIAHVSWWGVYTPIIIVLTALLATFVLDPWTNQRRREQVMELVEEGYILRLSSNLRRAVSELVHPDFGDEDIEYMLLHFRKEMLFLSESYERISKYPSEIDGPEWKRDARDIHRHFVPIIPQVKARALTTEIIPHREGTRKFIELNE